jgi:hypothetical protein
MGISIGQRYQQFLPAMAGGIHHPGRGHGGFQDARVQHQLQGNANGKGGQNWCGPAVGTTLARMLGTPETIANKSMMAGLAEKYTTAAGTTPDNMVKMIDDVGGRVDGKIMAGRYSNNELDRHLEKGNAVVAQIGLKSKTGGPTAAHWVMVTGKNANGTYTVKDPLRGEFKVTADKLREAVYRAPGLGGVLIPVAPDDGKRFGGPWSMMRTEYVEQSPADQYVDRDSGEGHRPEGYGPYGFQGDGFQGYPVVGPHRFLPTDGAGPSSFVDHAGPKQPVSPLLPTPDVDPAVTKAIAAPVVQQLRSSNEEIREQGRDALASLEKSSKTSSLARRAFDFVMKLFGRQPGGGQRPGYNGYGW